MTNAVWLFMQWHNVDVPEAKILVQQVTNGYEKEFQQNVASFVAGKGKDNIKLQTYLKAQGQQIPGNVAWSLRCPRYHPELCEAGKMLYSTVQGLSIPPKRVETPSQGPASTVRPRGHTNASVGSVSDDSSVWSAENTPSPRSSVSSASSHVEDLRPLSLGLEHLLGPSDYISSLPSKGVREAFIDALNVWLMLPDHHAIQLKCIAQTLHNASLMLDDIEDSSPLRRDQPATHMVFGQGQTINSANFLLIKAVDQVRQLEDEQCLQIFLEEMQNLFAGQSCDLYWTRNGKCPSYEKYMEMIRQKTGSLFRLLARLMTRKASALCHRNIALESLTMKLGEYFQIRDDYKNLTETVRGSAPSTLRDVHVTPCSQYPAKKASAKTSTKANSLSH